MFPSLFKLGGMMIQYATEDVKEDDCKKFISGPTQGVVLPHYMIS